MASTDSENIRNITKLVLAVKRLVETLPQDVSEKVVDDPMLREVGVIREEVQRENLRNSSTTRGGKRRGDNNQDHETISSQEIINSFFHPKMKDPEWSVPLSRKGSNRRVPFTQTVNLLIKEFLNG